MLRGAARPAQCYPAGRPWEGRRSRPLHRYNGPMPELTLHRLRPIASPPMVCMYCGRPATHADERWVPNPRDQKGKDTGGGADVPAVSGDDPVSAAVGLVLLPIAVWEAVTAIARYARTPKANPEVATKPPPPLDPPHTKVVITACDRHRHFSRRFVWAGLGGLVLVGLLWAGALRVGVDSPAFGPLLGLALVASIAGPIVLSLWYCLAGPVIVDRVTQDTAVLDRVRLPYFDATGIPVP